MGKNSLGDIYGRFESREEREDNELLEKQEREAKKRDKWLRARCAEPGDPDYDELDSLTGVEEYIEEHFDELSRYETRALKEEYGIMDDEDERDDYEGEWDDDEWDDEDEW